MKKRLGEFWVVYDGTKENPDDYVAIQYFDSEPVRIDNIKQLVISPSIDLIRELLKAKKLICLPPDVDGVDNVAIVELWVKRGDVDK